MSKFNYESTGVSAHDYEDFDGCNISLHPKQYETEIEVSHSTKSDNCGEYLLLQLAFEDNDITIFLSAEQLREIVEKGQPALRAAEPQDVKELRREKVSTGNWENEA